MVCHTPPQVCATRNVAKEALRKNGQNDRREQGRSADILILMKNDRRRRTQGDNDLCSSGSRKTLWASEKVKRLKKKEYWYSFTNMVRYSVRQNNFPVPLTRGRPCHTSPLFSLSLCSSTYTNIHSARCTEPGDTLPQQPFTNPDHERFLILINVRFFSPG